MVYWEINRVLRLYATRLMSWVILLGTDFPYSGILWPEKCKIIQKIDLPNRKDWDAEAK